MNHASGKASNAVLAKARALYGRRLRAEDYRRLTGLPHNDRAGQRVEKPCRCTPTRWPR